MVFNLSAAARCPAPSSRISLPPKPIDCRLHTLSESGDIVISISNVCMNYNYYTHAAITS